MNVLFVLGGPGFSSRREAEVLAPSVARRQWNAAFWDDPWRGQPNGHAPSWDDYLAARFPGEFSVNDMFVTVPRATVSPEDGAGRSTLSRWRPCVERG